MRESEKERLAELVVQRYSDFEEALTEGKRKYPTNEFRTFADAVKNYAVATQSDKMIHRMVVNAVCGLRERLQLERKRVPGAVLYEADRLECLLLSGYDPHFEGDEPPGF